MKIYMACNDRNLFFSEEENSTDVNKYYVPQDDGKGGAVDDYILVLSREVPPGSRVLDVGCAQGKFGRVLSEKNCVLWGIDINQASIQFVRTQGYYQNAFVCDVTSPDSEEFQKLCQAEKFDAIILSDVLEHLPDPTSVLLHLYPLLSENGCFLVSVPNLANLDICLNLLDGRFNYSSIGILDNTHLKFFTKDSFVQWIDLIGQVHPNRQLHCSYLGFSYYESDYVKEIRKKHPQLFRIATLRPEYIAFQLFFRLDLTAASLEKGPAQNVSGQVSVVDTIGDALAGTALQVPEREMAPSEREALLEKDAWIAKQEEFLKYRETQLKELEAALAGKDEVLAERDAAIGEKDAWIVKQEEFLKYRETQVKELEAALAGKDEVLAERDAAIGEKDAWIAEQEKLLAYSQAQLREKESAIADLDGQVKQLVTGLDECRTQLKQKEDALVDRAEAAELLRVELDLVKKRLAEIENSRLWRMTRFLHG